MTSEEIQSIANKCLDSGLEEANETGRDPVEACLWYLVRYAENLDNLPDWKPLTLKEAAECDKLIRTGI